MRLVLCCVTLLASCNAGLPPKEWYPRVKYWQQNDTSCMQYDNGGTEGLHYELKNDFCRSGRGIIVSIVEKI